ncbi:MAG: carbohydrate-binding domain-containing protein [Acetatifactor sp.]|nr:carbohydrate-binding domain-containing protein [Acetatifactor sp.]
MSYKKIRKILGASFLSAALTLTALTGCGSADGSRSVSESLVGETGNVGSDNGASSTQSSVSVARLSAEDMFSDRDKEIGYEDSTSTHITLADNASVSDSNVATISDNTVTIAEEGTYILSGSLSDGQIIVDVNDTEKVQLILDNVNINCDSGAAIYVRQADKVFITLAAGSNNYLYTSGEFIAIDDNNVDAVIFSKDDLTLNGNGSLTIESAYGHGIVSKNDLRITGGSYAITAASSGLNGKDSVRILDGTFALTTGKDGIHSENTDEGEEDRGFIFIAGGSFAIDSEGDGLDASNILQVEGGSFAITAGSGSANAEQHSKEVFPGGRNNFFGGRGFGADSGNGLENDIYVTEDSTSSKGMKSDLALFVLGGNITIDAADDALHTNGNLEITGGSLLISSGDDGVHADDMLVINSGTIVISESYEGLEGTSIIINGGDITLTASDDGINAAGGNDRSGFGGGMWQDSFGSGNSSIEINGGTLKIDAAGDGIDSNGSLLVTGGEIYVSGPTDSGNGALDYASDATITGGIVVATGSSGMACNFGSNSTQGSMLVNFSTYLSAGDEIKLSDGSGNVLMTYTPSKSYNSVVISCPDIKEGATYTLTAGSQSATVEMTSLIYGSSTGDFGGFGGGRGGMGGGDKDGNRGSHHGGMQPGENGEASQIPDGGTPPEMPEFDGSTPPEMPGGDFPQGNAPGNMPQGRQGGFR